MAKIENGVFKVSGTFGDHVITQGKKQGGVIRRRPKKTTKARSDSFNRQLSRTVFLNKLASQLNKLVHHYYPLLRPRDLYARLLGHLRKEPLDNRFLLLKILKGFEIHPRYQLNRLSIPKLEISQNEDILKIDLLAEGYQPDPEKFPAWCYELILACWTEGDEEPLHSRQYSDWIEARNRQAYFEFEFTLPAGTLHWLLLIHQRGRALNGDTELMALQGIRIVEAGTLLASDQELWLERDQMKQQTKISALKEEEQVVRVKARVISDGD